ncbi:putative transcription factor homeobox-WOX family [Helianthus annuus]|nr:putative transcription factor homeobox-WOX family [Helianthus annuus]
MDYGGGPGGGSGGSGRGSHNDSDKKKRYHRHTALQIQILESTFKECPHPDEKTRMQLSRELDLAPRQIKFWFQNRRTQMKVFYTHFLVLGSWWCVSVVQEFTPYFYFYVGTHERADNCALRVENDKIRCENIVIREALKNLVCPTCGGPRLEKIAILMNKNFDSRTPN